MLSRTLLTLRNLHLLVPITIAWITGILWQAFYSGTLFTTLILFVSITIAIAAKKSLSVRIIRASLVLIAYMGGAHLYHSQHEAYKQFQQNFCGQPIAIRGIISDIAKSGKQFAPVLITIELDAIKPTRQTSWIKTKKSVQLYTRRRETMVVGDTVELQDIVFKASKNATEFENYLVKMGISATAFTQTIDFKLVSRPTISIKRWIHNKRETLLKNLGQKLSPPVFSLFSSLFLGNRTEAKYSVEQSKIYFKIWGILHFLARSGLHLVIFIFLWEYLLRFIPIAFALKQVFLFILVLLYFCLSWASVPFIRAFLSFLFYKLSLALSVRTLLSHILILVCLIMLAINPTLILSLDFQLSFGMTYALALFGQLGRQKIPLAQKH